MSSSPVISLVRSDFQNTLSSGTAVEFGDAHTAGDNGWMLDVQEQYDPATRTLYSGSGPRRTATDVAGAIVRRMAGNGGCCYNGEGLAALNAKLDFPFSIKVGSDGSLYLAEGSRVRVVAPDGTIRTLAGNGTCCYSGDGGSATSAQINVADIGVGNDGTVYIADFSNRIRMVKNGIITTIAGTGACCSSGNGGPATAAQVSPQGLAVGDDGTIYFSEGGTIGSVRRITPDGIVTFYADTPNVRGLSIGTDAALYYTDSRAGQVFRVRQDGSTQLVAGRGNCSSSNFVVGDGGKATDACLKDPWYAAADRSGVVYVADRSSNRIRAVLPDGTIRTVAGNGISRGAILANVLPATSSIMDFPFGIDVHPNGMVYFTDWDLDVVWRIEPGLPGQSLTGDALVPSEDGSRVSVFRAGQHLRTVDALTGVTLLTFGYDSEKRLTSVTDADGNLTTLERDTDGNLAGVVAPNGQRTVLTTTNGLLATVTDPAGGQYGFDYYDGALLKSFTTPRGMTSSFLYDSQGHLARDTDAAGGFQTLTRTGMNDHYIVNRATAEGRTSTYEVEYASDGAINRTNTAPTGEVSTTVIAASGQRMSIEPDGTIARTTNGPDPRFGIAAPIAASTTLTTGSQTLTAASTRQITLSNPNDIFSLTSLVDTITINGKAWLRSWNRADRSVTARSPLGRTVTTTLDAKGRVASVQVPGLAPASLSYNASGLLQTATQGTRTVTFEYDTNRYLQRVTGPLQRAVTYHYDALGHVVGKTMPDGATLAFGYDADGNLTSVTPPTRPSHGLTPTAVDLLTAYTPPSVTGSGPTRFAYNRDRQLTLITRPDQQTISFAYDHGRLASLSTPSETYRLNYEASTGRLASVAFDGGVSLAYTYSGALLTKTTWSGTISGSVSFTYDNDLRLASENGVALTHDADGLLASAGALIIARDPQNGLLTGTTIGAITDTITYNSVREPASYTASFSGAALYHEDVTRDDAGQITSRTETLLGGTNSDGYSYDDNGRLRTAIHNGAVTTYDYDPNGNRVAKTTTTGSETSSYDDQDRLLSRNGATYTYSANGELQTKTDSDGVTAYQYDVIGNLRHVTLPSGTSIDYVIDARNRRVGKKVNGTLVAGWLYADQLHPMAELDGTGAVVSQFVYASRSNVPDYMIRGGATYRIIANHLGSPRVIVDATTGAVAQMVGYDEFGNVTGDTSPGFQPFGFAGGLYDPDTGLVRFGARDYDAQTGRWTAKDTARFEGGDANLYAYVSSDPINVIDPTGTWGVGVVASETTEAGVVAAGAGQTGSVGIGYFQQNGLHPTRSQVGVFASWGGFADSGIGDVSAYPSKPKCGVNKPFVAGAYAGGGTGFFLTNANDVGELKGEALTMSANWGWGQRIFGLQLSLSTDSDGRTVWLFSFGFPGTGPGVGYGGDISAYNTNTAAAPLFTLNH